MTGELYINNVDAYTTYGISLEETGVTALLTPPAQKDYIENNARLRHGKIVTNASPKKAPRELTLVIHMFAKDKTEFLQRYSAFCENVLATGYLEIKTSHIPDTVFRCYYKSCSQFSEFMMSYASFTLKLEEPDPSNRIPAV